MQALKLTLAALATAAVMAGGAANAATFTTVTGPAPNGSLSWDFGNTGGISSGAFTDVFNFVLPSDGVLSGSIQSTYTSKANNLTFSSVDVNGTGFGLYNVPGLHGGSVYLVSEPGGTATLTVTGTSPGIAGSYTGHLTFTPGAVPEPASWALMITGFAGAGIAFRKGRGKVAAA